MTFSRPDRTKEILFPLGEREKTLFDMETMLDRLRTLVTTIPQVVDTDHGKELVDADKTTFGQLGI
jgi:hypothetical protein